MLRGVQCLCRGCWCSGVVWDSLPRRVPAGVPPGRSQFRGRSLSNLGCLLLFLAGLGLAANELAARLSGAGVSNDGPAANSSAPSPRCCCTARQFLWVQAAQLMTGGGLGREIIRDRAPRLENMPPSLHQHRTAVRPHLCSSEMVGSSVALCVLACEAATRTPECMRGKGEEACNIPMVYSRWCDPGVPAAQL